jgi:hypothetical protein
MTRGGIMDSHQPVKRALTLGDRYPRQVALLRVAVGIWLLLLTAVLSRSGHGGLWVWLLAATAALHFGLAYRLLRHARNDSGHHIRVP